MFDELTSKMTVEQLEQLIKNFQSTLADKRQNTSQCLNPELHSEISKDLIDYLQSKDESDKPIYRELYKLLNSEKQKLNKKLKLNIGKIKDKYNLEQRNLYLNGESTKCKHLCLHHKEYFIPTKPEIQTIFDIAHKEGHSWELIKKNIKNMGFYNSSSSVLFKALCGKCAECKGLREDTKKKKRLKKDTVSLIKGKRPQNLENSDQNNSEDSKENTDRLKDFIKECDEIAKSKSSNESSSFSSKGSKKPRKSKKIEDSSCSDQIDIEILSDTNKILSELTEDQYPFKKIKQTKGNNWIGIFINLICCIPEFSAAIINSNKFPELNKFIIKYWKPHEKSLEIPNNLIISEIAQKYNRNLSNYKDFWQTFLYFSSEITPDKALPSKLINFSLSEYFLGNLQNKAIPDNILPFFYLTIKIASDVILTDELPSKFSNFNIKDFPLFFAVIVDRIDYSSEITFPIFLNLSKYAAPNTVPPDDYKLCHLICCCVHEEENPQFFSYTLNPITNDWYMITEDEIKQVRIGEIDFSHTFFAIYRQKDDPALIEKLREIPEI